MKHSHEATGVDVSSGAKATRALTAAAGIALAPVTGGLSLLATSNAIAKERAAQDLKRD